MSPNIQNLKKEKMRFRKFPGADAIEKNLSEWIVQDSQGYYKPIDQERCLFSKQNLFVGSDELHYLIYFPPVYTDTATLHIWGLETPDHPYPLSPEGGLQTDGRLLVYPKWTPVTVFIYPNETHHGVKMLSSSLHDGWIGYIYDNESQRYIGHTPSLE